MVILVTGATGFIGSNISDYLQNHGHQVIATYRSNSSFDKCSHFKSNIDWINIDECNLQEILQKFAPDVLIHTAWGGIGINERDNWDIQIQNFKWSKNLFDIAAKCGIKKIVALGSQAEYGLTNDISTEEDPLIPQDAYGAFKVLTSNYLRLRFHNTEVNWYWVRVFSLFGENENNNWLIPQVISKLAKGEAVSLTKCEQKYNYLYIKNFVHLLDRIIVERENKSGIYNICNTESIQLKELLLKVANLMDSPKELLKFGDLSYRHNQNMYIHGDNSKYLKAFAPTLETKTFDIDRGLKTLLNFTTKG